MTEVEKPSRFRQQVRVRWVDTDASRRIHYTAMFRFFEVAESEFMRSLGFTSARFREMGLDLPRVHVSCDFKVPILHDELLQMGVSVERVGNTSVTLRYVAEKEDGTAAAEGRMTFVTVSLESGRPVAVPDELRQALSKEVES